MADLFCESLNEDFTPLSCGTETGRIIALGLVDPDNALTDPSDDTEWQSGTTGSPQIAWVITDGVRGEMTRATDTEEEGFGLVSTEVSGADHSVTLQIKGLDGNVEWTNKVNKNKWHVALPYSAGQMFYVDVPTTVTFRPAVSTDLKSSALWEVTIKWSSINNPTIVDTPVTLQP
jgi:hypothetical protein